MEGLKGIIKILRNNFYLYYRTFGPYNENTQHAYNEWKDTVIGAMEEEREHGR